MAILTQLQGTSCESYEIHKLRDTMLVSLFSLSLSRERASLALIVRVIIQFRLIKNILRQFYFTFVCRIKYENCKAVCGVTMRYPVGAKNTQENIFFPLISMLGIK